VPGIRAAIDIVPANVIVAMVAAGLGFSVMPSAQSALLHASGARQIPLDKSMPTRLIALDSENPRVQAVVESIRQEYQLDPGRGAGGVG
jgi:DNA-binding transcriptional LysR family regulator